MSHIEKRASERIDVRFKATVNFKVQGKKLQTKVRTKDFSAGGVYFVTDTCPKVGDEVNIRLHLEESGAVFETVGTVLRVDQLSETTCGFAAQFKRIPDLLKM